MSSGPNLPPRSHSLKISDSNSAAAPLAVAFDYDDNEDDDQVGSEEKRISEELVTQAKEALAMVDDGWSKDELRPVVPKLIDRVEKLVSPMSISELASLNLYRTDRIPSRFFTQ